MKKQIIFLLVLFLFRTPFLSAADEKKITFTTYYPAPYGDYKTLKASESITVTGPSGATATNAVLKAGGYSGTGLVVTNANKVGIGTTDPKGVLDLTSTSQAFFPPRVTTSQRNAIASVTKGAVVYNTTTNALEAYDGSKWVSATSAPAAGLSAYRGYDTDITRCPSNDGTFTGKQVCESAGKTCVASERNDSHKCDYNYDCSAHGGPKNTQTAAIIFCK